MTTLMRGTVGVALLACGALSACSAYQVAPTDRIALNSSVRVRFSAPTNLTFQTAAGDSLVVDDVIELDGRVVAHSGNMITMVASGAKQGVGFTSTSSRFASPISLLLALGDDTKLLTSQLSVAATAMAVILPVGGYIIMASQVSIFGGR